MRKRYPRPIARSFQLRRAQEIPGVRPYAIYAAALLLALLLPFEAIPPVIAVGGASVTDEKLVLLIVLGAWVLQGWRALPAPHEWRALLPTLLFLLVGLVSARLSAEYADEATRFAARLIAAAFGLLVALRVARETSQARAVLWAIVIGGGASALFGIGEALGWPPLTAFLGLFKVAPTRVGSELRVSGTFQYATIAAMYWEMAAPLAIVLAASTAQRSTRLVVIGVAMLCTASVVLTLTRAGMLSLALLYAALLICALTRKTWRKLLLPTVASTAVLLGGTTLLLLRNPVFDLRLVTESDADWYGAVYSAPPALTVMPDEAAAIDLEVRNAGRITWTRQGKSPFVLGYRWLTDDGSGVLDLPPMEIALPRDVEPGATIRLRAQVVVPDLPAGTYRLDWGMLQRDVVQFYERGWADAETSVSIPRSSSTAAMPDVRPRDDSEAPWVVGRLDLWSSVLRLFATHPLLGVGPDNFRHLYGAELGLEGWDERVQANNLYLEILADLGILGLAAFAWVVATPLGGTLRALRGGDAQDDRRGGDGTPVRRSAKGLGGDGRGERERQVSAPLPNYIHLGVVLAIAVFLVHGLLDTFLAFTPTALLFWMLLGIAEAQKPQVSGR